MRRVLPVLLLLSCPPAPAAAQAPERIGYPRGAAGPGTVIRYEERGHRFTLVVIGEDDWQTARTLRETPRLILVEQGDRPPYGEFWRLHWGLAEPGVRAIRLVPGELRGVVPNVGGWE